MQLIYCIVLATVLWFDPAKGLGQRYASIVKNNEMLGAPNNSSRRLHQHEIVPDVLYTLQRFDSYTTPVTKLQRTCGLRQSDAQDGFHRPSYVDFSVTFTAKSTSKKSSGPCQIDTGIVGDLFKPYDKAPFITLLKKAVVKTVGKDYEDEPYHVKICGIADGHFGITCPLQSEAAWASSAKHNADAAKKDKSRIDVNKQSEADIFRKSFRCVATVYGINVLEYVDVKELANSLEETVNHELEDKYGPGFKCQYHVFVVPEANSAPPARREVTYKTTIVSATLKPDGYEFPGDFYTDNEGNPQYQGPMLDVYQGDKVNFQITNKGMTDQATHFHGIEFRNPYNYNDGATGFTQGTLGKQEQYTYQFIASPAGTSWYHGHAMEALLTGNRAPIVIRKRPCDDAYAGWYDDEMYLGISMAMPWFVKWKNNRFTNGVESAVRHTTGMEDADNFLATNPSWPKVVEGEPNYPYSSNGATDPDQTFPITVDYGGEAAADQPWAGILFNGQGRGIPLDYSSEPGSGKALAQWGPAKGEYFAMHVKRGKTYRLRILNQAGVWGLRVWVEKHDMTIISISGGDVKPIKISPPKPGKPFYQNGLELQAAERYDVLITADQEGDAFMLHVESVDGCYKDVAFILYDDAKITNQLRRKADKIKNDRTCDADCYDEGPCDPYKAFASDRQYKKIESVEPEGLPPPNKNNYMAKMVITQPDGSDQFPFPDGYNATSAEPGDFYINDKPTPVFRPYIYRQQVDAGGVSKTKQDPEFLKDWSYVQGQVIDWCVVGKSDDRHPIHFHSERFWLMGMGMGDLEDCEKFKSPKEGKPTLWADVINTLSPTYDDAEPIPNQTPGWVRLRTKIVDLGVWPFHCHLEYHMYNNLVVPYVTGPETKWPAEPSDHPDGDYIQYRRQLHTGRRRRHNRRSKAIRNVHRSRAPITVNGE